MIAGVCGGLGEYFEIDPTLVRLAVVFFSLWMGGGLLLYLIAWFIIPEERNPSAHHLLPDTEQKQKIDNEQGAQEANITENQPEQL